MTERTKPLRLFDRLGRDKSFDFLVVAHDEVQGPTILGAYDDVDLAERFMDEYEDQWGARPRLYQFIAF